MGIAVIDPTLIVQLDTGNSTCRIPGVHDRRRAQAVTQPDVMAQLVQRHSTLEGVGCSSRHLTTVDIRVRIRTLPEIEATPVSPACIAIQPTFSTPIVCAVCPVSWSKSTEVSELFHARIALLNAVRYDPFGGYTG